MSARQIVLGIIESMDVCDATRSHEASPAARLRARARERRAVRVVLICTAGLLVLSAIAVSLP